MTDIFVAPKIAEQNTKAWVEQSNTGLFSSFCHNPRGVSFQTQKPHETVILFLRSHFATNISWIFVTIILVSIPIIVGFLLPLFQIDFLSSPIASTFTKIYVLFYYLMVSSYAFISFLHWFYNVFIVSSERIVDIDYSEIVVHNIAVASLTHVQDVNYNQSGFIPTLFNFGDIFVQTAGNEKNFESLSAPKPREATHIIGDLTGKGPTNSG